MSRFKINKLGIIPRIPNRSANTFNTIPLPPIRQTPIPTARDIQRPVIVDTSKLRMPELKVGTAPVGPYEGTVVRNPNMTLGFRAVQGSGSLEGFSGFRPTGNTQDDNDPTAPWNTGPFRKWRRKTLAGDFSYQSPGAQCPSVRYIFLGTDEYISDPDGPTTLAARREYGFQEVGPTCSQYLIEETLAEDFNIGVDETSATLTQSNVIANDGGIVGTGSRTLETPQDFFNALNFELGTIYPDSKTTSIVSIGTTQPGAKTPIAFTDVVAVALDVYLQDLESGGSYSFNIIAKRTNTSTQDYDIVTIKNPFSPPLGFESTTYYIPVEVGFTYEYLSNQLIKY